MINVEDLDTLSDEQQKSLSQRLLNNPDRYVWIADQECSFNILKFNAFNMPCYLVFIGEIPHAGTIQCDCILYFDIDVKLVARRYGSSHTLHIEEIDDKGLYSITDRQLEPNLRTIAADVARNQEIKISLDNLESPRSRAALHALVQAYPLWCLFEEVSDRQPLGYSVGPFRIKLLGLKVVKHLNSTSERIRYEITDTKPLGQGTYGTVYKSLHTGFIAEDGQFRLRQPRQSGIERAVKIMLCHSRTSGRNLEDDIRNEAKVTQSLRFFHGKPIVFTTNKNGQPVACLVTRYFPGKRLSTLIKEHQFSKKEIYELSLALLQALKSYHDQGYVHKDIKPDNILVDYHEGVWDVVIIDCGFTASKPKEEERDSQPAKYEEDKRRANPFDKGTPHYAAPECFHLMNLNDPACVDIYAMAIVFLDLLGYKALTNIPTPRVTNPLQQLHKASLNPIEYRIYKGALDDIALSGPLLELIRSMCHRSPNRRPDVSTAINQLVASKNVFIEQEEPFSMQPI